MDNYCVVLVISFPDDDMMIAKYDNWEEAYIYALKIKDNLTRLSHLCWDEENHTGLVSWRSCLDHRIVIKEFEEC